MAFQGYPAGHIVCIGLRRWKARNLQPILASIFAKVSFVGSVRDAMPMTLGEGDFMAVWGSEAPAGVTEFASERGCTVLRMEDGFYRSVGLGSDLIPPMSLALDSRGIYFDPRQPSDLEHLLNTAVLSTEDLERARDVCQFITRHGLTKYNTEVREVATWDARGQPVVLVPGQVEDDASIRHGTTEIRTNLALLRAAREARPGAFLVYKPHPDVASLNRIGKVSLSQAALFADHIETRLSVVSCIQACDEVHTMTSQSGFEALLHQKHVVAYGAPFYAGWGLTEDRADAAGVFARRSRRLTLEALVAVSLLKYPVYFDWQQRQISTCEMVLQRILDTRTKFAENGTLEKLRSGFIRRQWRKANVLAKAFLGVAP